MPGLIAKLRNGLIDFFWPKWCVGCGQIDTLLCELCTKKIQKYDKSIELFIADCALDSIAAIAQYEGVAKKLVTTMKYQRVREICGVLGELAARAIQENSVGLRQTDFNSITAVPMHPKRLHQRGFHQTELIARALADSIHIPYLPLLKKIAHTAPQAEANRQQRLQQIQDTIVCHQPLLSSASKVLVIDDVVTTGATLHECAKALKRAGALEVHGLAIAHGL